METYITNIEFINAYLNNQLSTNELKTFHQRLTSEPGFAALLEEQQTILNGMKRTEIKTLIENAETAFLKRQLLKKSLLISTVVILTGIAVWFYSNRKKEVSEMPQTLETVLVKTEAPEVLPLATAIAPKSQQDSVKTKDKTAETIPSILINIPEVQKNLPLEQDTSTTLTTRGYTPLVKKAPLTIHIDSQTETTVFGNQGTKLVFNANTFVNKLGQSVKGKVKISLNEYYTLEDIILANLSTSANEKLLETGGMVHITATQGNELLQLSKPMEVTFGGNTKAKNMQLFSGNELESNINWTLVSTEMDQETTLLQNDEIIPDVPFAVVENVPVFEGCTGTEAEKKACTRAAIQRHVRRKFNMDRCPTDIPTGNRTLFARLKIKRDGRIEHLRSNTNSDCLQKEIKRVLESMPLFVPGKQRGQLVDVLYSLPIRIEWEGSLHSDFILENEESKENKIYDTIYNSTRTDVELLKELLHDNKITVTKAMLETYHELQKKKLIRNINKRNTAHVMIRKAVFEMPNTFFKRLDTDSVSRGGHVFRIPWGRDQIPDREVKRLVERNTTVSNYVFESMQMGWLNCDRFVNGNGPRMKFKLKIKDADGANVKLVFKNMRSILNGNQRANGAFDFGSVTKNVPVTLVAIQKGKNGYYMGMKDIRIEDMKALELNFKAYTSKELRKALKTLAGGK